MITYNQFQPTEYDARGLGIPERQHWLVLPCTHNRDSSVIQESNFAVALELLGGEGDSVEVHRFGHWANGWFEIILINPNCPQVAIAEELEEKLDSYGYLDEDDYYEHLNQAAQEVWKNCYSASERIEYIRKHESEFEFYSMEDLMACCRGKFFSGDAVSLVG